MRLVPAFIACAMSVSLVGCVIPADEVYVVDDGRPRHHHVAPPPHHKPHYKPAHPAKPLVSHKPVKQHPKPAVHKPAPKPQKPTKPAYQKPSKDHKKPAPAKPQAKPNKPSQKPGKHDNKPPHSR